MFILKKDQLEFDKRLPYKGKSQRRLPKILIKVGIKKNKMKKQC